MRVVIINSGGYLDKRIERVLLQNNINGDIKDKLTRNMFNQYDCVIFTHQNDIPNLPNVIERIVFEKKIIVILVNSTVSIGYYYNIHDDLYFAMVNESSLEVELPFIIKNNTKFIKRVNQLEREKDNLSEEIEFIKNTNRAKRILINKGFTEAESHKYIQQKAMSMRVSKSKLVNLIIENKIDI